MTLTTTSGPDYTEAQRVCPSCGVTTTGEPYDIGDGPEFACANCEWCWGANGQDLTQGPIDKLKEIAEQRGWGGSDD